MKLPPGIRDCLPLCWCGDLPGIIVPGGVTLPALAGEDAGTVQTIGARFAHNMIDLDYAANIILF